MRKKRHIKNTWYYWLINYIVETTRKTEGGFKENVVSLFKGNTSKDYGQKTVSVYDREKKPSKPKTQKQSKENKLKV